MRRQNAVPSRPRRLPPPAPRRYAVGRDPEVGLIYALAFAGDVLVAACGPLDEVPPVSILPRLDYSDPWAQADVPIIAARLTAFERLA